jgi:hypothetical protein
MRFPPVAAVVLVCLLAIPTSVLAQSEKSHWGVVVAFTPEWSVASGVFEDLFETKPNDLTGSEFQIGIARGRTQSGDWGVSLVRRKVKEGSTIGAREEQCDTGGSNTQGCFIFGDVYAYNDVMLTGFEVHKYLPFVTIKRRLQIGINFSGGMGVYSGTATQTHYDSESVFVPPNSFRIVEKPPVTTPGIEAKTLFVMENVPLGKLELAVAGILAPGLKVRIGYGLDFPGYPIFSVAGVALFGRD